MLLIVLPRAMRRAWLLLVVVACCQGHRREPAGPARIVTLTPSATEIVAALGAGSALVGVDKYSEYPPEVRQLPKVGDFLQPDLEAIIKLAPTLVIVDDIHGQVAGQLHDAGLATIECAMHGLPDVKQALRRVGARLGRDAQAAAVVAEIDRALDDAAAKRPAHHPRVLAVIDREAHGLGNLIAAGTGSWLDELLAVVGGDNVLAGSSVRYPKITLEEVLRGKPDVILDLSEAGKSDLSPWQAVDVPAVHDGHVRARGERFLQGPSPRVRAAVEAMATAIAVEQR